jgi:1-phosphatidylinositol-3-phosphate 5-kinase
LIDPELIASPKPEVRKEEVAETPQNKFWMPDRFCKVCYGCEEAFTMYRRRHHCRMCGQIFCNGCSSFYIDGKLFNTPGLVRSCRLCYDQQYERGDLEHKAPRSRPAAAAHGGAEAGHAAVEDSVLHQAVPRPIANAIPAATWIAGGHCKYQDVSEDADLRSSNLQKRYEHKPNSAILPIFFLIFLNYLP